MSSPAPAPMLRTLPPMLRQLERNLRAWLDARTIFPRSVTTCAALENFAADLSRQADALDVEQPALVIMLMGGTGVGKSTLLNALAGGAIAQASFQRPTTYDPVVYYHHSLKPETFDPKLRLCRLASHDRPALEHKILVDTPDIDSTQLANREKLLEVLPVADVVLYVGSQEKYHDQLGWQLFLEQRRRRAFAFVMNKWDRCLHGVNQGMRPDHDLLRDLKEQGFENPQLFRTCAQHWVDKANGQDGQTELPEGEEFLKLIDWLEAGLNKLEIAAIKGRGIVSLLEQLEQTLQQARPPDLAEVAGRTRASWEKIVTDEAKATADILLNTLEPYQREIEHHFIVESQRRFRPPMSSYLNLVTRMKYIGNSMRDRLPFLPRPSNVVDTPAAWDLAKFTSACSTVAGEKHLDARTRALADRLLLEANQQGFPLDLLTEPTENAAKIDWRQRYAQALVDVLQHVEQEWAKPTGFRRFLHTGVIWTGNILPTLTVIAAYVVSLWDYFMVEHRDRSPDLYTVLLVPLAITLVVMFLLHLLITLVLPLRWSNIRSEFQRQLEDRLIKALTDAYIAIPLDRAEALQKERQNVEKLQAEVREISNWLEQRQQAANIAGLYGN